MRRFRIVDGMILVAASAASAAIARPYMTEFLWEWAMPSINRTLVTTDRPVMVAVSMAMITLLVLRLSRPRPPIRELARQPGFASCAAATFGFATGLVRLGCNFAFDWDSFENRSYQLVAMTITHPALGTVPGAWLALLISGRWKAEASWADRMGRLLGAYWIALHVEYALGPWINPWVPAL